MSDNIFYLGLVFLILLNFFSLLKIIAIAQFDDEIEKIVNKYKNLNLFGYILLVIYIILIIPTILIICLTIVLVLIIDSICKLLKIICFKKEQ